MLIRMEKNKRETSFVLCIFFNYTHDDMLLYFQCHIQRCDITIYGMLKSVGWFRRNELIKIPFLQLGNYNVHNKLMNNKHNDCVLKEYAEDSVAEVHVYSLRHIWEVLFEYILILFNYDSRTVVPRLTNVRLPICMSYLSTIGLDEM